MGMVSLAENENIKVSITSVEPFEMEEGGDAELIFEISNLSDYELTNITIRQGSVDYEIPDDVVIPCPGTAKIPVSIKVLTSQLGKPMNFEVGWNCGGEPQSAEVETIISKIGENDPSVLLTSSFSKKAAKEGDTVIVSYTLNNTSKFDMTDILITDSELSMEPVVRNGYLKANDEVVYEYEYRMGQKDAVSQPEVTYVVAGKAYMFSCENQQKVTYALMSLKQEIQVGAQTGQGIPFTIKITNNGNQMISDINILDDLNNKINEEPFELSPESTAFVSYTEQNPTNAQSRNVVFTINGKDPFGDTYSCNSKEPVTIFPFVDDSQINIEMNAAIIEEWSQETGSVTVRVIINNNSNTQLLNASISEANAGVLTTYPLLNGGTTQIDLQIPVATANSLYFALQAFDVTGNLRTLGTCSIPVTYAQTTQSPEEIANGSGIFSNSFTKIIIILGAVVVLGLAVLLILTILDKSSRNNEEENDKKNLDVFDQISEENDNFLEDNAFPELNRAKKHMRKGIGSLFFEEEVPDFNETMEFDETYLMPESIQDDYIHADIYHTTSSESKIQKIIDEEPSFEELQLPEPKTAVTGPKVINVKQEARQIVTDKNRIKRVNNRNDK